MPEQTVHGALLVAFFALAVLTFPVLFFVSAPYGRYTRSSFGPTIHRRLGWVLMEAPAALVLPACFLLSARPPDAAGAAFLALWLSHYLHRAFIFPFRMRGGGRRLTVVTVALAVVFNGINGYLNGRYLSHFAPPYGAIWLAGPLFLAGTGLFLAGMAVNLHSDTLLIRLRGREQTGYAIPHGGLFRYVSCPNYLGEIVEWSGWALATWSWPGLAFAVWTAANLAPRALTHHRWYRKTFADYPPARRALVPFVL